MTRRRVGTSSAIILLALTVSCSDDTTGTNNSTASPAITFATQPPRDSSSPDGSAAATAPAGTAGGSVPIVPQGDPVVALAPFATVEDAVDLAWRANDPTLFVVDQDGLIVPVRDGQPGDPVLDVTDLTGADGERGLLGLAFSPDGATAYIDYTDNDGDTVIASYPVGGDGVFDPAARTELLTIDQPYPNHNGGNVMIGPDGMLYIGMGDGGAAGDPERRALNVTSYLGKILRIDPVGGSPYAVPPDNPFVGIDGALPEIWSVGVRNPWRMSFDPATGDLWIADVGQNAVEEVDVGWAADGAGRGMNFGWSAFEGTRRYNDDQSPDGVTPPIHEYEHGDAGCSISGGAVYRGAAIPALVGWFVFGDYCSGNLYAIRAQDRALTGNVVLGNQASISAVRAGPDGELYVLSVDGTVSRVVAG
jgi:glucose/arabinose dehydrogenase